MASKLSATKPTSLSIICAHHSLIETPSEKLECQELQKDQQITSRGSRSRQTGSRGAGTDMSSHAAATSSTVTHSNNKSSPVPVRGRTSEAGSDGAPHATVTGGRGKNAATKSPRPDATARNTRCPSVRINSLGRVYESYNYPIIQYPKQLLVELVKSERVNICSKIMLVSDFYC